MRNRAVRSAASKMSHVCQVTIRVAATLVFLTVAFVLVLRYFGIPVPSAEQVIRDAARIL
jgi:hypothetical protein